MQPGFLQGVQPCVRNLSILHRADTTDTQATDDDVVAYQRHTSLGWNHAGEGKMDEPST